MATRTQATQAQRPMPNIMDYEHVADWQVAWRAWDQERAVATERQARIHAARSNAAKRGAATRARPDEMGTCEHKHSYPTAGYQSGGFAYERRYCQDCRQSYTECRDMRGPIVL